MYLFIYSGAEQRVQWAKTFPSNLTRVCPWTPSTWWRELTPTCVPWHMHMRTHTINICISINIIIYCMCECVYRYWAGLRVSVCTERTEEGVWCPLLWLCLFLWGRVSPWTFVSPALRQLKLSQPQRSSFLHHLGATDALLVMSVLEPTRNPDPHDCQESALNLWDICFQLLVLIFLLLVNTEFSERSPFLF